MVYRAKGKQLIQFNRRSILAGGGILLAAGKVSARAIDGVDELYRKSIALDTLMSVSPADDEKQALAAGLSGGVCDLEAYPRNKATAEAALAQWAKAFADPSRRFLRVESADDFMRAKQEGRLAVVLASQNAAILDTGEISNADHNLAALQSFYTMGLRLLLLTYTDANSLGDGYNEPSNGGLKNLGRAVVPEMNRLGMMVDVSHSGERTSLEAIDLSTRPVAVSHAGCLALDPNLRNKSDKVIRALADKGGYFGIYNMTLWMTRKPESSVADIVDHIDHAVNIGGIDLVGFGSDQNLLSNPTPNQEYVKGLRKFAERNRGLPAGERQDFQHVYAADINRPDRLLIIARALKERGYKAAAIEKILGGNFIRAFRGAVA